jgi:hypothetical protein
VLLFEALLRQSLLLPVSLHQRPDA